MRLVSDNRGAVSITGLGAPFPVTRLKELVSSAQHSLREEFSPSTDDYFSFYIFLYEHC